jgi:uncharacterized repeat protein (TIGR04138 family)
MEEKKNFHQIIEEICAKDSRYKADSYEFLLQALHFTQKQLKKEKHITGQELCEGVRGFTIEQYGPMAKTVLNHWGIHKTQDLGNIVFNLIDKKLLSKTEEDSIEDFRDVYDFESAFGNVLRDSLINGIE